MGIALEAYCAAVGLFSMALRGILIKLMSKKCFLPKGFHASSSLHLFLVLGLVIFFSRLLTLAGDVELNPGPNQRQVLNKAMSSFVSDPTIHNTCSRSSSSMHTPGRLLDGSIESAMLQPSEPTVSDIIVELRSMQKTFDEKFDQLTTALDTRLCAIDSMLSAVQSDIVSLTDRIAVCESETKLKAILNVSAHDTANTLSMDDVMSELNLREHKKNNIIISGLRFDPNKADTNLVIDLLNEIGHHNITPKVVERIGKSTLGKPKLVLARLATQEDRLNILRDAKLLRQSTCDYTHLNIYINPDRTHIEMKEFKKSRTYRHNHAKKNSVPGSLPAYNSPVMSAVSTIVSPL